MLNLCHTGSNEIKTEEKLKSHNMPGRGMNVSSKKIFHLKYIRLLRKDENSAWVIADH